MATELNPWPRPIFIDISNNSVAEENNSFLHSQKLKKSLLESKKAFLNLSFHDEQTTMDKEDVQMEEKSLVLNQSGNKRAKKISFKIKKTSSIYRRGSNNSTHQKVTLNANSVADLTKKFNQIISENKTILEEPKFRKLVKRVNSQKSANNNDQVKVKVSRKPSVKTKPNFNEVLLVKNIPTIVLRKNTNNSAVRAKMGYLEKPLTIHKPIEEPAEELKASAPAERPTTLNLNQNTVKATIEIFERRTSPADTPKLTPIASKPKIPEKNFTMLSNHKLKMKKPESTHEEIVEAINQNVNFGVEDELVEVPIMNIPAVLPQRRCDSMYETLNMKKIPPSFSKAKSELIINSNRVEKIKPKPNTSFLWRDKSLFATTQCDLVDESPEVPPRPPNLYEEHDYEPILTMDDYEYFDSVKQQDNIYEILPRIPPRRQQQEPLPPRPPPSHSSEVISNCYESIYNPEVRIADDESNYESIYGCQIRLTGSNRDSLISSDQQSNSLYGARWSDVYNGKASSDLSSSDRSDEWIDLTDNEEGEHKNGGIIILREKKSKKSGWSQHFRDHDSKKHQQVPDTGVDTDSDHHYESLANVDDPDYDYDSFDSDTESEHSFKATNLNDSGVDIANNQLPEPPNNTYVLTRIAATAGKHMRKLRRNWSLTKNDISKSLSRMTKRKSRTDLDQTGNGSTLKLPTNQNTSQPNITLTEPDQIHSEPYQNIEFLESPSETEKSKTLPKKSLFNKFRRSMSMSPENATELTSNLSTKPKSTFYLTETIDVDEIEQAEEANPDSGVSLSPVPKHNRTLSRPQSPPPPAPVVDKKPNRKDRRASSWYAEAGLFKNSEKNSLAKRPNTFWYAEIGLYQPNKSASSTSSAENSGNNDFNQEEYYNMKNGGLYHPSSVTSFSSSERAKLDETCSDMSQEMQLRLLDEPLYQFYDAAILESVCHDGVSDYSDGYEEVGRKLNEVAAVEIILPKRNSIAFTKTLWCEIPEVIQSAVLSTLNPHQKKLQEAKFEILTSEASYLNSLNVLIDHFAANLKRSELVMQQDFEILFGQIEAVKMCSEKLLLDLEKCWLDNILLNGVCDTIQKHADESFEVYVFYCANQILLDDTLKKLKENSVFAETLRQLESSPACQNLSLYSFLMLPMQRITRWPLLVDAMLKRLSQQDQEFENCQMALATLNKIVSQCNEAARRKERENELKKLAKQLEFPKGFTKIDVFSPNRWLIRSGTITHMQQRTDETKLTFGKRFTKSPLHLFLFNDVLFVAKAKGENSFSILHHCPRNLVELTSTDALITLPVKETQGRYLLFMTILENQDEKTVELLLACNSESDKERWIEALTAPKSENPDETLYECWDCPQVTAIHNYVSSQPDELPVARGDVINVLRKMADGWYHGERIRDGETGWFPANYTVEIANPHVRARNLKQRYRLLAFSENYLKNK